MIVANTKISPGISLVDETLDLGRKHDLHLSIQVGFNAIYFSVFNLPVNKYMALETYTFQGVYNATLLAETVGSLLTNNKLLQPGYKTVSVAFISETATLVPDALYNESNKAGYIAFNHPIEHDSLVMVDQLKQLEAKNVYAIPEPLNKSLNTHFGSYTPLHFSSVLIEAMLKRYRNHNGKRVIVHVQFEHFEVIVLEANKLIFYNSFSFKAAEDLLYYLLFVCEQLKLNPESIELNLYGEVDRNSTIYNLIYKYVRNVRFGELNDSFDYSYKFKTLPPFFYFNIFNQYLLLI